MSFPYRDETKRLNDEARKSAPGSFISLPQGITHYELSNSDQTETVVLVHGFSVPYFVFDPTFDFLTRSGFRTLRYDLFGRGFSDRPHVQYNVDLFIEQLLHLVDALRFSSPFHLIGLSMGGPITASFTSKLPERIKSLTLIDPSGAAPISLTPLLRFAKIPIVAETIFGLMGTGNMVKSAAKDFYDPRLVDHFIVKYKTQMQYHGFQRALLSTIRNNMLGSFVETFKAVGRLKLPVMLLWGRDDMTVPFSQSEHLRNAIPNVQFHVIENCGHIPHYEKPNEVNPILLKFLRSQ